MIIIISVNLLIHLFISDSDHGMDTVEQKNQCYIKQTYYDD